MTDRIDRRMLKVHRSLIMYGPPGKIKTKKIVEEDYRPSARHGQISDHDSIWRTKIGIVMLGPPMVAGELERPLVGQSEAVISRFVYAWQSSAVSDRVVCRLMKSIC